MSALVCEKLGATKACPRCGDLTVLLESLREELEQLRLEGLCLSAGTITAGFQRLEPV